MEIDFNNVRVQAGVAYNKLTARLQILVDNDMNYHDAKYIEEPLEELRSALVGILASYLPNDPRVVCVLDKFKDGLKELNTEHN